MKEEKELLTRMGRQEPFTVPDGYFESLTERVMQRLPEKVTPEAEPLTLWQRVKPWVYMTAMFAGLMCSMRLWMERPTPEASPTLTAQDAELFSEEEMEYITERSMLDDYSLYQYLSEEE
jgi:hypothetical protein